ncbi:acyltransferase [Klebsiella sp. JN_Kp124]|uniref:acyltransferase family protein n=1 Tax=Klebsiella sp. JN_Kp124 TaxID=3153437 RepID=UPI0032B54849
MTFFLSKYSIGKLIPLSMHGRFIEIDGLRGYLALMVAAHHFYIIYAWVLNDEWKEPDFIVFNNLGVFAVSIFFMITGFLFIGKIDRARLKGSLEFFSLMKSRIFRICPLYVFAVFITVVLSFHTMLYQLSDANSLVKDIFKWMVFLGDSVNGYHDSKRITAGVTWTLRYEWLFYISLAGVYFISKIKYGLVALGLGVALFSLMQIDFLYFNSLYLIFFVLGGVSYFFNKKYSAKFGRGVFKGIVPSLILLLSLVLALFTSEKEHLLLFSILCFIFFMIVVMGGDFFGLFCMETSRALGEISYSIYLMHGIVFFILFRVMWPEIIRSNFYAYSLLLPACLFCVVLFSTFTFLKIELPFINAGKGKLNFGNMLYPRKK